MSDLPSEEELHFGSSCLSKVLVVRHTSLSGAGGVLAGCAGGSGDATGLMLWPGARALCRALASYPSLQNAVCIELGAGCGVCSAVAGLFLSPRLVITTDGDERALTLARATWRANPQATAPFQTHVFRWGADYVEAARALLRTAGPPSQSGGPTAASGILVLASECIYPSSTPDSIRHFFGACAELLRGPCLAAGTLLLSYVPRSPATSLALLAATHAAGLRCLLWRGGEGDASAAALGCAESLGSECGAVVLVCTLDGLAPHLQQSLEEKVAAVFPDAAAAVEREKQAKLEAEAELASGAWGAPPL